MDDDPDPPVPIEFLIIAKLFFYLTLAAGLWYVVFGPPPDTSPPAEDVVDIDS